MSETVIADGDALGDRFVAVLGTPRDDGWTGSDELFGPGLPAAVDAVSGARGAAAPAVAATLLFEQYALRLAAPVVAAHARDGALLDAHPSKIRVRFDDGAVRRLAFADPPRAGADPGSVAASLRSGLEPAAAALRRHARVGDRTLRGTMANAVVNAYLHLSWRCADRARHVGTATAVLAAAGWSDLVRVFDVDGWMYTDRNTCCLAFRTSVNRDRDQHYCLTCPITPRATTLDEFTRATASFLERQRR